MGQGCKGHKRASAFTPGPTESGRWWQHCSLHLWAQADLCPPGHSVASRTNGITSLFFQRGNKDERRSTSQLVSWGDSSPQALTTYFFLVAFPFSGSRCSQSPAPQGVAKGNVYLSVNRNKSCIFILVTCTQTALMFLHLGCLLYK